MLNHAWFATAPPYRAGEIQSLSQFFHPLDRVADWNRLYGPRGFIQYQCVVPDADTLREVIWHLNSCGVPAALGVIKKFGAGNPGPLSFPRPGWTLALDTPATGDRLGRTLDDLDRIVAERGGAVYLTKDSRLRPDAFAAMYCQLSRFRAVRERVDPDHRLTSDLSRRLSL
jgi:decaprenylphospho-beta-D-ribofuranose 2-oxidase